MKQQFSKITLLLFILISFINCEKQDDVNLPQTNEIVVKQIKKTDLLQNLKLTNKLNEIKKSSSTTNSKTNQNKGSSDFTVNTEIANYALLGDKHTYSFVITRNYPINKLENLLLVSNDDGEYDTFILEYNLPNNAIISNENSAPINTNVTITPINFDYTTSSKSFGIKTICNWDIVLTYIGEFCDGCGYYVTTIENFSCSSSGSGGSGLGGYGPGSGSPTGGGSSSSGSSNSTPFAPITPSYEQQIADCLSSYIFNGNTTIQTFLNSASHDDLKNIDALLDSNECNSEAQEFALLAIEALLNNEFESVDDIIVFDGPDTPITDIADFLKCFDITKDATVTIYVTEPNPGSGDTHVGKYVGHTFVSIT